MNKKTTKKKENPLAILKRRVELNYADFKNEVLCLMDEMEIYDFAHRIAAVKDTYEQLTSDDVLDSLDEGEVEFLLNFYNPLEMVADFLQNRQAGYPIEIDEALMELFNAENHEESYLTMNFAEELICKYGSDVRIKVALLMEIIEAGENYLRLLKLTTTDDDEVSYYNELCNPFKPADFDEDDFFDSEDDKEGCF